MKVSSLKKLAEDIENLYGPDTHVYISSADKSTPDNLTDSIIADFTSETVYMKPLGRKTYANYDHIHDDDKEHDSESQPTVLLSPKWGDVSININDDPDANKTKN